jgi:environmental stress-induced protein Ves
MCKYGISLLMTGIDFKDTVVVRSTNKGTSTISGPVEPSEFMGKQNRKADRERMKLAGDLEIMSAKGTTKIRLSEMKEPKKVDLKGYYISTGKGTGRIKI